MANKGRIMQIEVFDKRIYVFSKYSTWEIEPYTWYKLLWFRLVRLLRWKV